MVISVEVWDRGRTYPGAFARIGSTAMGTNDTTTCTCEVNEWGRLLIACEACETRAYFRDLAHFEQAERHARYADEFGGGDWS